MRGMMIMSVCAAALTGPAHAFDFGAAVVEGAQERSESAREKEAERDAPESPEAGRTTPESPDPEKDGGRSLALPDALTMSPEERAAEERRAKEAAAERARLERLTRPDGDLPDLTARIALANFFSEAPEARMTPEGVLAWYGVGSDETCREAKDFDEFARREKVSEAASDIRVHDVSVLGPFNAELPEYDFDTSAFPFSETQLGSDVSLRVQPETARGCRDLLRDLIDQRVTARITGGLTDLPMASDAARELAATLDGRQIYYEAALSYAGAEEQNQYRPDELQYDLVRIHFYSGIDEKNELNGYLISFDLDERAWVKGTGEVLEDGSVERSYQRIYPPEG